MKRKKDRKCPNCKEMFVPDYRNVKHQEYCSKPECRKASKAASQRRWSTKPENVDYFKSPLHVQRAQEWRKNQPKGISKKKTKSKKVLQDHCHENLAQIQSFTDNEFFSDPLLQDFCKQQPFVIIGLIAQLTGAALQDNIETAINRMRDLGRDFFIHPNRKGGLYDPQTTHLSGTGAKSTPAIQLDRPPSGSGTPY